MTLPLVFSPDVAKARAEGTAIVALESTIITHGMPYPQNVETAARLRPKCAPMAPPRPPSQSWPAAFTSA